VAVRADYFIDPSLTRTGHRAFLAAIQVFARFFGKVMPGWMALTLILHLFFALADLALAS
jgi:hypothetical protein